ncbi:MAG: glycosyltransferase family 61 protein, partial [Ignavibacteria bacterium]
VLKLLSINETNLKIITSNVPVHIENYILPSIEPYSGFVTKQEIKILREMFLPLINNVNNVNKIYISRRKTKKRKLRNELKLEEVLKTFGFVIVYLEELPFLQQVEIINNADFIVAPHGAGLANLAFAKNNCKVIEIFPYQIYNDCFARLSLNANLHYNYIRCEYDEISSGIIPINEVIKKIEEFSLRFIS